MSVSPLGCFVGVGVGDSAGGGGGGNMGVGVLVAGGVFVGVAVAGPGGVGVAVGDGGGGKVGVGSPFTMIVPLIEGPCTVHMYRYVPGWLNVNGNDPLDLAGLESHRGVVVGLSHDAPHSVVVCELFVGPLESQTHVTSSPTLICVTQLPFWKELSQNQLSPTAIWNVAAVAVGVDAGPKCSQSNAPVSASAATATPTAES